MAGEMAELTQRENEIFNNEWDSFVAMHYPHRDFVDVFEDNKNQILDALKIAKFQLESEFGGINAKTNEIGWTPIQPNFLLATTTPTYATTTWKKNLATSDVTTIWKDWLGSSSTNVQLSKYATMIVIGFHDPVELPKISAIKATIKGDEYPIWWVEEALRAGVHIYELPQPFLIEKEQNIYLQYKVYQAGDDELRPIGVYFGRGDHLRDKNAYAKV